MKNGIHLDLAEDTYHADPGSISKTGLWTLHSKTPAHFKFAPPREPTPTLGFGKAVHMAVLEPKRAKGMLVKGPPNRRGNAWKDFQAVVEERGLFLLTEPEYDSVLEIQAAAQKHPIIAKLNKTDIIYEASAFWKDEATGQQCRVRPDIYAPKLKIMTDLKTSADASAWNWAKTASNLGYHVQEAMYTEGWQEAGGGDVDAFIFIVIEQKAPYCTAVYEFEPSASVEGSAVFRKALEQYKECKKADHWPGYSEQIQPIDLPHFAYRETDSPNL